MPESNDWQPACSRAMLLKRAQLRDCVREFFTERGYLEVDTPVLSAESVVDAHLNPLEVVLPERTMYLQTSPEAAMKRLLAAGSGSIFQLSPAFRAGEIGHQHNPEFTMLEWYGVDSSWQDQVALTEQLVRTAAAALPGPLVSTLPSDPFPVTTYQEAFRRELDIDVLEASMEQLQECLAAHTSPGSVPDQRDDVLNLLLASSVEPHLGEQGAEFLVNYPASQAALAELAAEDDRVACRFELYLNGLEICNGYQELRDGDELRRRELSQQAERQRLGASELPGAPRLLSAMDAGLPRCSGVALGFDRLLMRLTGVNSVKECLPFPDDRA